MTNETTNTARKGFMALAVAVAVVALAVVLGTAVGCAPKQAGEGEGSAKAPKEDPMATQQVDWTMDIDCKTCHTTETETWPTRSARRRPSMATWPATSAIPWRRRSRRRTRA